MAPSNSTSRKRNKSAEKILVQAAHVCNAYAKFGKKAGVSDKWIGLIENEIKERINLMFGLHPGEKLPLLPHKKKPQRKPSDTGGPKLK